MCDYPKVRAHHICPVCNGAKDAGLVACWPCWRTSVKRGDPAAERKVQEREAQLSGIRRVIVGRRPVDVEVAADTLDTAIEAVVFLVAVQIGQLRDSGQISAVKCHNMIGELRHYANRARVGDIPPDSPFYGTDLPVKVD